MEVWFVTDIDTNDLVIAGGITQHSLVHYSASRNVPNDVTAYIDIPLQKMYVNIADVEQEMADVLITNPVGFTNLTQANFNIARDQILNS